VDFDEKTYPKYIRDLVDKLLALPTKDLILFIKLFYSKIGVPWELFFTSARDSDLLGMGPLWQRRSFRQAAPPSPPPMYSYPPPAYAFPPGGAVGQFPGQGAPAAAPAPVVDEATKKKDEEKRQADEEAKKKKDEEAKLERKKITGYTLKLVGISDGAKFKVLKEVRAFKPGLTIPESKVFVEQLPSTLGENMQKEEADKWVEKLKQAGAEVELE